MGGGYVVYADILLALNFFLDFFLLWASGRFLRLRRRFFRLLSASLLGAIYGAGIVIWPLAPIYSIGAAIVVSFILIRIAYPWKSLGSFVRLLAVFYLMSFALAGAALAGESLLSARGITLGATETVTAGALIFGIGAALALASKGVKLLGKSWRKDSFRTIIEIGAAGHSCNLRGLIDTGNDLREPLSRLPVIVCDTQALRSIIPYSIYSLLTAHKYDEPSSLFELIMQEEGLNSWGRRMRLVPFASIGKTNGMMLGFLVDKVTVTHGDQKTTSTRAVVCLANQGLPDDDYDAIVNPDVLMNDDYIKEVGA